MTEAGQQFVAQVAPAVQDIHEAMEVARSQQAVPSGTLRINAFSTAAREIFSSLVLPFLRAHPQVHIDIVTEGRLDNILPVALFEHSLTTSYTQAVETLALS